MRDQRTFFDLTQDGLVIGKKIQRIYVEAETARRLREIPFSVAVAQAARGWKGVSRLAPF